MVGMFYKCVSLTTLDLSNFNTINVTSMNYMFSECSSLTILNLSNFNTDYVNSMNEMFYGIKKKCKIITENSRILEQFENDIENYY